MSPVEKLLAGHETLYELIAAEVALCTGDTMPDPADALLRARWAVARALMEQITFEETHVLAPLDASTDPMLQVRARTIRAKQTEFIEVMFAHAYRWPAEAVARDWPGFRRAMAAAHHRMIEQLLWEKRVVVPAIIELDGASATPTRNWARAVWEVKDVLTGGGVKAIAVSRA